jgi:hypothetical protein
MGVNLDLSLTNFRLSVVFPQLDANEPPLLLLFQVGRTVFVESIDRTTHHLFLGLVPFRPQSHSHSCQLEFEVDQRPFPGTVL